MLEVLESPVRPEKEVKATQIGKEGRKPHLFADNMGVCIEIPKEPIKKK